MGFDKSKDRFGLRVRGARIRAMVSLRKKLESIRKDTTAAANNFYQPQGLRVNIKNNITAWHENPA